MRKLFSYTLAGALIATTLGAAQTPAKKKAAATSAHKKGAPAKAASTRSTAHKKGSGTTRAAAAHTKGKSTATAARRPPATTWRNRQMSPSQDRYKEIQGALASRGYLNQDDVNGSWGQSSTEALKKFQADQKIDGGGKLNSLSIIALGLGPKHDTAVSLPPKPEAHSQESH